MPRTLVTWAGCLLGLTLTIIPSRDSHALRKRGAWNVRTSSLPDAKAGGWFINLGITGARAKILPSAPRVLEVAYVFEETPAFGKLKIGDRITGVNGRAFVKAHRFGSALEVFGYDGPMKDFGEALEESQARLGGRLTIDLRRGGGSERVNLNLPTASGAFAASYPFDCPKSDRILDDLCLYLLREQRPDGLWHRRAHVNAFAALALLGSGSNAYRPALERAARAFALATTQSIDRSGLDSWKYGLYGIFLAEYYLATRDSWVLPELEQINRWLHKAQLSSGGWGHQPGYELAGSGYGGINVITMQAKMAWALMMRCGLSVDPERFGAAHEFARRGTNRLGYVWYKDGGRDRPWCADMGRTGASALAHHLTPSRDESYRRVALTNARCIGHFPKTFPDTRGSPLLGMAWTALGSLVDPAMFRRLLDENRWHFALSHCPEGNFYYQPNRDGSPQDFVEDPRLGASAVTALILSVKHKRLQLTGAEPLQLPRALIGPVSEPREAPQPDPRIAKTAVGSSGEVAGKGLSLPGLTIDMQSRFVDIDAKVCLDQGSLELVACTADSKEHESIVVVDARPMHIHTALLLLGARQGNPAMRKLVGGEEERLVDLPPRGDRVRASLVFEGPDGKSRELCVSEFIACVERDRRPPREFLFAGSRLLADERGGRRYLADSSGHVISLTTFGDELLCLPGVEARANGAPLWQLDSIHLPGIGTRVTLRLRLR